MSTRCTTPQACAAGSTRWAILWVPNVTVRSARTCPPVEAPGVHVDTRRNVHRHHRHSREATERLLGLLAEARSTADADDPVDDHVGLLGVGCSDRATSGRAQRREPVDVHLRGQQHRLDRDTPARQRRPGPQRVTPVVARSDEQQHPGGVRRAQEVCDGHGETGGRPLHQGTFGQPGHQLLLGRANLLDRVCAAHGLKLAGPPVASEASAPRVDSRTTNASAKPPSWDSDRCTRSAPQPARRASRDGAAAARSARPARLLERRPRRPARTVPPGAPSAFDSASFAANRAASESTGRAASAGVNSRSRSVGRAFQRLARAARSRPGRCPTPDDHADGITRR